MPLSSALRTVLLLAAFFISTVADAQSPVEEIGPLPTTLTMEQLQLFQGLSNIPITETQQPHARRRVPRFSFQELHHPLTPSDVVMRESVRSLGRDAHRFVHCELKDRSVVTGPITSIGSESFYVRTGVLERGRFISYWELRTPPRPVAAVGTHLKNGFEMAGAVGLVAIFFPLALVLGMTGVLRE